MKLRILALTAILTIGAGVSLTSCGGHNPISPSSVVPTPTAVHVNGGLVSTFAGNGTSGVVNGSAVTAEFEGPLGIAEDSSGNIFVSDYSAGDVRKISNGVVTTFATGFSDPYGLATDSSGNVYVADYGHNEVQKITAAGVVSVLAGNGTSGFVNGPGASAEFKSPLDVSVDASGNVYVTDYSDSAIRKITQTGGVTVSTLAGNGTSGYVDGAGVTAEFDEPYSAKVDNNGNVYVADYDNSVIRKITPAGLVSTFVTSYYPYAIAVDAKGDVFANTYDNDVFEYSPTGVPTFIAGSGQSGYVNGTGANASFDNIYDLVIDAKENIFVADYSNDVIREIQ